MNKTAFRKMITDQATLNGNSVSVGHYINNGTAEIAYPKEFKIGGDSYSWHIGGSKIKGKSMSSSTMLFVCGPGVDTIKTKISIGRSALERKHLTSMIKVVREARGKMKGVSENA